MPPRTILYTGKGGVGKTSVAAATARRCAAAGLRTVVVSTDPAHSLSDSLETELGGEPRPCGDNLWGQEVQAQEEMERHWEAVQDWMGEMLAEQGVERITADELTVPPGMDELFSLLQIKAHHEAGEFDAVIVVDAPEELQVERMLRDRGWTEEDARARIAAQATREQRRAVATYLIDNTGTREDLRQRVTEVFDSLLGG